MYDDVFYLLSLSETRYEVIWITDQFIEHGVLFYILLVYLIWTVFETTTIAVFLFVSLFSYSSLDLEDVQEDLWFKFKYTLMWGDSTQAYENDDPRYEWWVAEPIAYLEEFCVNSIPILFLRMPWWLLVLLFLVAFFLGVIYFKLIISYVYNIVYPSALI